MKIFLILFGSLFAMGLFFIVVDILKLPKLSVQKAMLSAGRSDKKATQTIENHLMTVAVKLSKFVRMDRYKRIRLNNILDAAGMNMTPEVYTAYSVVKSASIAIFAIPAYFVFPFLVPVILFLSLMIYFKESKKAGKSLNKKRSEIEGDLPRFVATIAQQLKNSRDVLSVLEFFKRNTSKSFARELDILTADMRSSNYEAALTRFETKINSPMLSDVVRGLIGVLRGDDGSMYFEMLCYDMKQLELQRLKAKALKIPPKIRVFSFVMLMCFLLTYIVIIASQILSSMGSLF